MLSPFKEVLNTGNPEYKRRHATLILGIQSLGISLQGQLAVRQEAKMYLLKADKPHLGLESVSLRVRT